MRCNDYKKTIMLKYNRRNVYMVREHFANIQQIELKNRYLKKKCNKYIFIVVYWPLSFKERSESKTLF